jgi:putative inorganic carbon (hco3(-)) transporter
MEPQPLIGAPAARRLGLVALAVVAITVVAASGVFYLSPYAPALVGGAIAAAATLVACLRRPIWALYAALFVVMLPNGLLPATVQSNLNRGLTVIAFSVWLVSVLVQRRGITWTIVASLMFAFAVWGLVTLLWADNLAVGFNSIQVYALRLVLYLILVANQIRTEENLDGLMRTLAISGWVLVLAGLGTLVLEGYTPGSRFRILELNENQIGVLALITLPGVLWQAIRSSGQQRAIKMLLSFAFVGTTLALVVLSGSRGSAISFMITLSAFWIWKSTRPWAKLSLFLLVVALVSMPLIFFTLTNRFMLEQGDTVLGGRETLWQAALQLIRENLWGGVGVGGSGYAVMPYLRVLRSVMDYESVPIHNPVLVIWAETGLPGILLYLGVLGSAVWLFAAQYRKSRRRIPNALSPYFALVSAVFVGYMVCWIKSGGMESDFSYFLLLALLVIPACLQLREPVDHFGRLGEAEDI